MKLEKLIAQNLAEQNPHLDLAGKKLTGSEPALQEIAKCTHLTSIDLRRNRIRNVSFLRGLPALEEVNLAHNYISDAVFLEGNLPASLRRFHLSSNALVRLPDLSGVPRLEWLDVNYNVLTELNALADCVHLEYLTARKNCLEDIDILRNLPALRVLDLCKNKLKDVSALAHLRQLTHLDIRYNRIKRLELRDVAVGELLYTGNDISYISLKNVGKLTELHLRLCKEIVLQNLPDLQILSFSSAKKHVMPILSGLPALRRLDVWDNWSTDFRYMNELEHLEELHITSALLPDVRTFSPLPRLAVLCLDTRRCHITDIDFLRNMPALQRLTIEGWNDGLLLKNSAGFRWTPALVSLYLGGFMVQDLEGFQYLTGLDRLDLFVAPEANLAYLSALNGLKELHIKAKKLDNLAFLAGMTTLEILDIERKAEEETPYEEEPPIHLNGLESLERLQNVSLHLNAPVESFEPLAGLLFLEKLDLGNNKIQEISLAFLESLPCLTKLLLHQSDVGNLPSMACPSGYGQGGWTLEEIKTYLKTGVEPS